MDLLLLSRLGRTASAGIPVLAGMLFGIASPVLATNPESTLLAMSLFTQETPSPQPIAKPKPAPQKPADAVAKVAPTVASPQASGVPNPPPPPGPPSPSAFPRPAVPGTPSATPLAPGPAPVPSIPSFPGGPPGGPAPALGNGVPPTDSSSYDPHGRRDPFQSMVKLLKLSQSRAELPPLQRLELSDVKLIGIVSDASGYYGLVQTPDGKGYTVRVGTLIGTNNGTIKSIGEQRIIVAEPILDITGKMTSRDIEILQRPKEGAE